MVLINIVPTQVRYMGTSSIDVYCIKPVEGYSSQRLLSQLEDLATRDESVLFGPKLVKIDSIGQIYDPMLDANKSMGPWKKMILEKYEPITYYYPMDIIGLITTKKFVWGVILELAKQGYKFKIGTDFPEVNLN